jgi:hypothetical protein
MQKCASQAAGTTVRVWSVLLPQLLLLAVRIEVAVYVASTTLEISVRLKGQYGLGGPSRRTFRIRGQILTPHMTIGSVFGSPVAGVLRNKLATLGDPL